MDALILPTQLLGIGFSLGMSGSCLLLCAPPLVLYFSGVQQSVSRSILGIVVFLLGRSVVYGVLGFLAGISATALQNHLSAPVLGHVNIMGGLIIMALGALVLRDRGHDHEQCRSAARRHGGGFVGLVSLFSFGILVGLSPCPPLIALMFQILLIADSPAAGLGYGMIFAAGTFVAGLVTIGGLTGLIAWLPRRVVTSPRVRALFTPVSAVLLILLGAWLILRSVT